MSRAELINAVLSAPDLCGIAEREVVSQLASIYWQGEGPYDRAHVRLLEQMTRAQYMARSKGGVQ